MSTKRTRHHISKKTKLSKLFPSSKPDPIILILTLSLTLFGLFMVYNASSAVALSNYSDQWHFFKLQAQWSIAGLTLATICYFIPLSLWQKWARPMFFTTLLLLVTVLIPGVSEQHLGARRWLSLGNFNFQPSEILKITLPLYLAYLLSRPYQLKPLVYTLLASLGLVVIEPDLSTTVILGLTALSVIWSSGFNIQLFMGLILTFIVGGIGMIVLAPYRVSRLLTFLDPTRDPLGSSYHIRQILIALGSGGLFGIGLGQSRQKYAYLPAATTDSIFAVIAEEVGFIGSTIVIIALALLILRSFKIVSQSPDKFSRYLGLGLCSWLGIQTLINLAAVVVIIPVTGVPLPLISYGGSSILASLSSLGIILRISSTSKS